MMETFQKQGDSIDKLTSLMNELSSNLYRKENTAQYKPRIHQGRNRGHKDRIDIVLETDPIVENEVHIIMAEVGETIRIAIIMVIEVIDPEMKDIRQTIGTMIDLIIEGKVLIKIMAKEIETEV